MALIGNYSVLNKTPGRWLGGTSTAHASGIGSAQVNNRSNWGNSGARRNMALMDGVSHSEYFSIPSGYGGDAWLIPTKIGGMSASYRARGEASVTADIKDGRNIAGTSDGVASTTATGQLVVSGAGTSDGVATVSGNILAALAASGSSDGVATATGSMTALGWVVGLSDGVATTSIVSYATGQLVGSIAPAVDLEAASFSTYLLDTELVETGLTVRETLRIAIAALGGKVSISGDTVTFRDVNDTVDRITATTDTNGQRTAVTLDPD